MNRVDQLKCGLHAASRVAVVAAARTDAVEPVLDQQKTLLAAVAGRFVCRRGKGFFQRVPLWLRAVNFEHAGRALACRVPVDPPLAAANGPAAFADPPRMPIATEESRDAAACQVKNGNATILDVGRHRAKDAGASGHANDRLAGNIQQRIEPVTREPTEEAAAAGGRIEQ